MKIQIDPIKLKQLDTMVLDQDGHTADEGKFCFNEAAAWLAGEPHTDRPKCVSRVIRAFTMKLNDAWDDKRRQALKPYIVQVLGTAGNMEMEVERVFICTDWVVREFLPIVLQAMNFNKESQRLRALPEIVDKKSAAAAAAVAAKAANYVSVDYASAASAAFAANAAVYARIDILDLALPLLDRLIRVTEG